MSFELDIGHTSQAGRNEVNEDFAALLQGQGRDRERGAIAAIADGVSTGGNGREAAQTTVNTLVNDYFATPDTWDTTVALDRILSAHNGWLASMNRRRQPAVGLTTLTAVVLRGQSYTLAHVGDTRAYLLRGGRLQLLTTDHVMAQRDFAHQLTRAMGLDDHVVVDYSQGELHSGDLLVLLKVADPVDGLAVTALVADRRARRAHCHISSGKKPANVQKLIALVAIEIEANSAIKHSDGCAAARQSLLCWWGAPGGRRLAAQPTKCFTSIWLRER